MRDQEFLQKLERLNEETKNNVDNKVLKKVIKRKEIQVPYTEVSNSKQAKTPQSVAADARQHSSSYQDTRDVPLLESIPPSSKFVLNESLSQKAAFVEQDKSPHQGKPYVPPLNLNKVKQPKLDQKEE